MDAFRPYRELLKYAERSGLKSMGEVISLSKSVAKASESDEVLTEHVAEALSYFCFEGGWLSSATQALTFSILDALAGRRGLRKGGRSYDSVSAYMERVIEVAEVHCPKLAERLARLVEEEDDD